MRRRGLARGLLGGPARRWLLVVLVAGLAWRVARYAVVFPMWGDEAFVAVNVLLRDVAGMLRPLEHDMVASVGFLWAEVAARSALGPGEAALRLVPFLAGLAAFLLFARLARERLSAPSALVAIALLAASYYPVRHGAEVKPYALDLLVAIPIFALAWRILEDGPTTRRWVALTLVSAVAVWLSWTAVFVAGGAWLALATRALARGGGAPASRRYAPWLAGGVVVALSFAAVYRLVGRGQQWSEGTTETSGQWSEHFPPLEKPWLLPLWMVRELTGPMLAYPNGGRVYGAAGTAALVAIGAVSVWRRGRRGAVALLLSPLVPMLVAASLRKYPFGGSARTTLHLAVPVCLLAGEGIVATARRLLSARATVLAARGAALLLALAALVGAALDVARPYKKVADRDCRDAIARLAARSTPDDAWIVFGRFDGEDRRLPQPDSLVPDLRAWGGSAARLRYQLLRHADRMHVAYGLDPTRVLTSTRADPSARRREHVLRYQDDEHPFPQDAWKEYVRVAEASAPIPDGRHRTLEVAERFVFGGGPESLDVLTPRP